MLISITTRFCNLKNAITSLLHVGKKIIKTSTLLCLIDFLLLLNLIVFILFC